MKLNNDRIEQKLNKEWAKITLIWGVALGLLVIYLVICKIFGSQLQIDVFPDSHDDQIKFMKYGLYAASVLTIVFTIFIRKFLFRAWEGSDIVNLDLQAQDIAKQQALKKYAIITFMVMATLQNIGIFGVILFFFSGDSTALYKLLIVSAAAILYFRPRKEELLRLMG